MEKTRHITTGKYVASNLGNSLALSIDFVRSYYFELMKVIAKQYLII